jgi:hypothetical protein
MPYLLEKKRKIVNLSKKEKRKIISIIEKKIIRITRS